MKVTITFDPLEERSELWDALQGWEWKQVIAEVLEDLRQKRKYQSQETISIWELEQDIHMKIEERNLDLWG